MKPLPQEAAGRISLGSRDSSARWEGTDRDAWQAFVDILATNETFSAPMDSTYALLGLSPGDVTTLEQYLQARAAHPQQIKQHVAGVRMDSLLSWWCMYVSMHCLGHIALSEICYVTALLKEFFVMGFDMTIPLCHVWGHVAEAFLWNCQSLVSFHNIMPPNFASQSSTYNSSKASWSLSCMSQGRCASLWMCGHFEAVCMCVSLRS